MGRKFEELLYIRWCIHGNKHTKRGSTSVVIREIEIKIAVLPYAH